MKTLALGLLVLAAAPLLPGQVQVTANGTIEITAFPETLPPSTQSTIVTGPTTFTFSGVGSATLTLGLVSELTSSPASPPFGCGFCSSLVESDVVLHYSSAVPIAGVLRLTLIPDCWMQPSFVDVDFDGEWEVGDSSGWMVVVPVVLASRPLDVRLYGAPVNFSGVFVDCDDVQRVEFLPLPNALDVSLPACGPTLGSSLTGDVGDVRKLRMHVGATQGLIGVLMVGTAPVPTPGACGPQTLPEATELLLPGPEGATFDVPIVPALLGDFTLQYVDVSLSPFALDWSNGVTLSL